MGNALGVDVSHWRRVASWDKLTAGGVSFVGIKATQGSTGFDPALVYHRDGFRSTPGLVGAIYFHYPSAGGAGDPAAEAANFLKTIGPLRDNERLALDVEQGPSGNGAPPLKWQQAFVAALPRERNRRPLIYTAAHVWNEIGNPPWPDATTGMVDLWAKQYATELTKLASPWSLARVWQNSDSATFPGIDGPCDSDVFMGDADALKAYFELAPAPAVA